MPIIRKITYVGKARGISLPKQWLDWLRREYGIEIREVLLEIDREIRIIPYIPKEAKMEREWDE
ncbi:MAG: hypothetical protein QXT30_01295 [Candidatus Bathyarchaeia archaeon]